MTSDYPQVMISPVVVEEEMKLTKRKLFEVASLWLILGLVLALVMLALPMARLAEAG